MHTPPPKTVIILFGPKGAGKTHTGTVLQRLLGVPFLRVEPIFIEAYARGESNQQGYDRVFDHIATRLQRHDRVCFESLGAAPEFGPLLRRLQRHYRVLCVRLRAPLQVCKTRVRQRSKIDHIPVSDDRLDAINAIASQVEMDWDAELDNTSGLSDDVLVAQLKPLLG